jgi:putative ABC transport system substrate-binding protein
MRRSGFLEQRDYRIEFAIAEHAAQVPEKVALLVAQKVDVIVASGVPSVLPARDGAGRIPIVFVFSGDPVAMGLVPSLARPGSNITGVTIADAVLTAKRFQILRVLQPDLSKATLVVRAQSPENARYIEEAERAGRGLGLEVRVLAVRDVEDLAHALNGRQDVGALVVVADAQFTAARGSLADNALKHRLLTMFTHGAMVEAGGLISYGPDYHDLYRQAAVQVHKILLGTSPAEIPVEQPTRFEQVINLRTAKALGVTVPSVLLANATNVIE